MQNNPLPAHRLAMIQAFESAMKGDTKTAKAKLKEAKSLNVKFYNTVKKALTIIGLFLALTGHAQQRVTKNAQGNYIVAKRDTAGSNKPSGKFLIGKDGVQHPVFISAHGKLFYMRTSKAGNVYKCYIKE